METVSLNLPDVLRSIQRLFLDTAPVIYHVEGVAAYQPLTDVIFQAIHNGIFEAVTSSVTLAECLVHPYRHGNTLLVQRFRDIITAGTNTRYVGVDTSAENAAELRARYNLSLTDAFQVAAAITAGCDTFLTNDTGLKRVTELQIVVLDDVQFP
jgi:predicted nucleic acid-binding protein